MARPVIVSFIGGDCGSWRIDRITTVVGAPIAAVDYLNVVEGEVVSD